MNPSHSPGTSLLREGGQQRRRLWRRRQRRTRQRRREQASLWTSKSGRSARYLLH